MYPYVNTSMRRCIDISGGKKLVWNAANNKFTGTLPTEWAASHSSFGQLQLTNFSSNQLTGVHPYMTHFEA